MPDYEDFEHEARWEAALASHTNEAVGFHRYGFRWPIHGITRLELPVGHVGIALWLCVGIG